ncbi:MAG: hypothetical protein QXH07_01175 [Thermoplasmata archaeon]
MRKTLLPFLLFAFLLSVASANSISISNTTLSTLNATSNISPASAYQLMPETYSLNVSSNVSLANATIYWNGIQIYTENFTNTTNATISATYTENSTGTYQISFIVYDNSTNQLNDTANITINQYVLPTVSQVLPTNATENASIIFNVIVSQGSYPLKNITWEFQNNYLTDIPFVGANYQAWTFNQSGYFSTIVQICDVNNFCSQSTTSQYVSNNTPNSYWSVSQAVMDVQVNYPNPETMSLTFIPNNDTNPIAQVSINWGDGTPTQVYTYSSPITSATYQHLYTALGNYSVYATTCDTIGNCHTDFISNVSVSQNLLGNIAQGAINTNSNTNTLSIFNGIETWFQNTFGNTLGTIVFYLGAIVFTILIIIVLILTFFMILNAYIQSKFK